MLLLLSLLSLLLLLLLLLKLLQLQLAAAADDDNAARLATSADNCYSLLQILQYIGITQLREEITKPGNQET